MRKTSDLILVMDGDRDQVRSRHGGLGELGGIKGQVCWPRIGTQL